VQINNLSFPKFGFTISDGQYAVEFESIFAKCFTVRADILDTVVSTLGIRLEERLSAGTKTIANEQHDAGARTRPDD